MKGHITADAVANRVRLLRSAHHGSILLVEGDEDEKLYGQFTDRRACRIQIAHGKPNLMRALSILEGAGFSGILAIADPDFSVLEGTAPASPNLLFADGHDLETMLLSSPALDKVLHELGDAGKLAGVDVREKLLAIGKPIGYVRWLSRRNGLSLLFEGIAFDRFVPERSLTLDRVAFLDALQGRSGKGALPPTLWADAADLAREDHDPWHVCCGHDLVEILSIGLRRVFGTQGEADVKPARLERSLRLAYERAHFMATRLFSAIRAWEVAHPAYFVLAS